MRVRFTNLVILLALPTAAVAVAGWCAAWLPWPADLCAVFPAQAAPALLLASLALALARRRALALAFLLPALLAASQLTPLWFGHPNPNPPGGAPLRVAAINLLNENDHYGAVRDWLLAENPDVFMLCEATPLWQRELEPLRARWPHVSAKWDPGCFGIALWSRWPLQSSEIVPIGSPLVPGVRAVVSTPNGPVGVLAVHPLRPGSRMRCEERDAGLLAITAEANKLPTPRVVFGDCNATRWTPGFRQLLAATGLKDTSDGMGWQATWPADLPAFLRIPIDQVLVSPDVGVVARRVGPDDGSDHRPVVCDLVLPAAH